jgi:hypothetical protein
MKCLTLHRITSLLLRYWCPALNVSLDHQKGYIDEGQLLFVETCPVKEDLFKA